MSDSVGPTCSFTVTVNDTQPPVITTNHQTITLWPPDHKYATVTVSDLVASASDNCDPGVGLGSVRIARVTSDEPNQSAGSGNTTDDIVIAADCTSGQLRAERVGRGNGRVYTIAFTVLDASGNVSPATAKVTVPHSQNGGVALDDGPAYTVLSGVRSAAAGASVAREYTAGNVARPNPWRVRWSWSDCIRLRQTGR